MVLLIESKAPRQMWVCYW